MDTRFPFSPFPTGWYVVTPAPDLASGQMVSRTLFGRPVVVYRTAGGLARVADAFCPHMGAHFGHGGAVVGELLRCPFHAFDFDGQGACVATPYGHAPPKAARLKQWPVRERNGFVLTWFDTVGREPWWEVPEVGPAEGWTPIRTRSWTLRSHPQETTENIADLGHFSVVHGYSEVETLAELTSQGHHIWARYAMRRKADLLGGGRGTFRAEFDAHAHGLGWSFVEARVPEIGMRSRHYVLPTPIDEETIRLTIGVSVELLQRPGKVSPLLGLLPRGLATRIVAAGAYRAYVSDVSQDLAIWENKQYIHPPALARGDGPVGRYRQWARQFYPELEGV